MVKIDITGQRFGRLMVQQETGRKNRFGYILWECLCDCGNTVETLSNSLRRGKSTSCGCYNSEVSAARLVGNSLGVENTTHGMSLTPTYISYAAAKQRCNDPKHRYFKNYGGRGIEFRFNSFEEFFAELGERPKGTTIDRIDNDGHYEKGNVRWATWKQQAANRRRAA